ncbi:MAG: LysR family transcriptional regulator [Acidimicrobiia bacterium]|nr:LysR family transcriptional regulator [Acidimicrobiia bacterium]NNL70719.1 LysR family transcriptional regulator [Acidimicrobiia bacterium]
MNLGLRHFRYFVAVAEELSFTGAAKRLHMAQPPLSRAIRELEEALGVTLLERTTRSVALTPAGRVLLEEAREVLSAFEGALGHARQAGRIDRQRLSVGFRPATSLPLLEPIAREFRGKYPLVEIDPHRVEWTHQIESLINGEVDVSFLMGPIAHPDLATHALAVVPRAVATPLDHPLAERTTVEIADLAPYAMAVPKDAAPEWSEFWTATPRPVAPGMEQGPVVANADESLAVILSGTALVITISTVRSYYRDSSIHIIPISDIEPATILLAHRRDSTSLTLQEFCKVAQDVSGRLQADLLDIPS